MPTDGDDEVPAAADGPASSPETPVAADQTGVGTSPEVVADPDGSVAADEAEVAAVSAGPAGKILADQMAAASEARRLLWPWVARRTRTQVIALVLISCLALGPAFALVTILRADPTPVNMLFESPPKRSDVTKVTVTAIRLAPVAGEMQARVAIELSDDLLQEGTEKLDRPVSVTVNGSQGTTRIFQAGETTAPFEVSLPLTEGNTSRYPFDSYKGSALIVVTADPEGIQKASPSIIEARSIVSDFDLSGSPVTEVTDAGSPFTSVTLSATRPATTTVYAVWLMILMWGLAVTGLLLVWAVVIWMVDLPFWAVGYLVGVLFALPPLRDSLPGRPPPGTIFDYGSFYWSITLIGVNLILVLVVWLRRVQGETRLRALDRSQGS